MSGICRGFLVLFERNRRPRLPKPSAVLCLLLGLNPGAAVWSALGRPLLGLPRLTRMDLQRPLKLRKGRI